MKTDAEHEAELATCLLDGRNAARLIVDHLLRMGATVATIPIEHDSSGKIYEVLVREKVVEYGDSQFSTWQTMRLEISRLQGLLEKEQKFVKCSTLCRCEDPYSASRKQAAKECLENVFSTIDESKARICALFAITEE